MAQNVKNSNEIFFSILTPTLTKGKHINQKNLTNLTTMFTAASSQPPPIQPPAQISRTPHTQPPAKIPQSPPAQPRTVSPLTAAQSSQHPPTQPPT